MPTGKRAESFSLFYWCRRRRFFFLFSQYRGEIAEAITKHSPTLFCFVLFFFYLWERKKGFLFEFSLREYWRSKKRTASFLTRDRKFSPPSTHFRTFRVTTKHFFPFLLFLLTKTTSFPFHFSHAGPAIIIRKSGTNEKIWGRLFLVNNSNVSFTFS